VTALATQLARDRGSASEPQASGHPAEPDALVPQTERSEQRLFESDGPTLEDLVLGAWEELVAYGRAECPVCGGEMSLPAGCHGCGAELS
jgi:hypothetical protein